MSSDVDRSLTRERNSKVQTAARDEALDKSAVAEIAMGLFSKMSPEQLIGVIRAAELPLVDARTLERLQYLDRTTLQRLAHLAQRCCRNQGN